jgi:hypothetical protein
LPVTKTYTAISPEISASSLGAGQVSFGGSYTKGENSYLTGEYLGSNTQTAIKAFDYYNGNARVGIVNGLDFGIDYSYKSKSKNDLADLYTNNYNLGYDYTNKNSLSEDYQSLWLNLKFQLTNKDLKRGRVIFTIGFTQGFGYGYTAKNNMVSITSLPLCLGFPINSTDLFQITNKLEYVDYSDDSYIRSTFGLGADIALLREEKDIFILKLKPRFGFIKDFADNNNSSSWYCNIGFSIDLKDLQP